MAESSEKVIASFKAETKAIVAEHVTNCRAGGWSESAILADILRGVIQGLAGEIPESSSETASALYVVLVHLEAWEALIEAEEPELI